MSHNYKVRITDFQRQTRHIPLIPNYCGQPRSDVVAAEIGGGVLIRVCVKRCDTDFIVRTQGSLQKWAVQVAGHVLAYK